MTTTCKDQVAGKILSEDQLAQYERDGYVLVKGAADPAMLKLARTVLERWVDETVDSWVAKGLLLDPMREIDFEHRLLKAWVAAGKPAYQRSPRRDLVSPELYQFFSHPRLLDLAEDVLGTPEIYGHSIFNARPKAPDQKWTDTPWHQDAQYFRDCADIHLVTVWIPLQRVTEKNSCLQVARGLHRGVLHEGHLDEVSGFIGLAPELQKTLEGLSIEMEAGDALCFPQKTPHHALPNLSDAVRWSMDFRYGATPQATTKALHLGFVARSRANPASVETYEQWLAKWQSIPKGSY